jgi:hypothetical protein
LSGFVHNAHTAASQFSEDFEVAEQGSDEISSGFDGHGAAGAGECVFLADADFFEVVEEVFFSFESLSAGVAGRDVSFNALDFVWFGVAVSECEEVWFDFMASGLGHGGIIHGIEIG